MSFRWATTPIGVGIYLVVSGIMTGVGTLALSDVKPIGSMVELICGTGILLYEHRRRRKEKEKRMAERQAEDYDCAGGRQIALKREPAKPSELFWSKPCPNEGTEDVEMTIAEEVVMLHMCKAHILALEELDAARRVR